MKIEFGLIGEHDVKRWRPYFIVGLTWVTLYLTVGVVEEEATFWGVVWMITFIANAFGTVAASLIYLFSDAFARHFSQLWNRYVATNGDDE